MDNGKRATGRRMGPHVGPFVFTNEVVPLKFIIDDSRKRRKLEKVPNWSPEPPDNAWTEVAHKLKWRTIVQTQIDIDAGCTAVQTDEDAASIAVGAAKIFKAVRDAIHPSLEEIVEMYRRPEDR